MNVPKLSDLRDATVAAQTEDATATATLVAAQNAKVTSDGNLTTATQTFAHGLQSVGGEAIDITATPPIAYATTDGQTFTTTTVVSLDTDLADPAPPTPPTNPPA